MNLTEQDALTLAQTLQRAGSDLKGLKAVNPWAITETPRARQIRMMVEGLNPAFANKLKAAAGHESMTPSLAYVAAQAAGIKPEEMTGEAKADHARFNPVSPEQVAEDEANILAKLDAMTETSQRKREGDRAFDDRVAREKSAREEAERRRAEGAAVDARIRARQEALHQNLRIAAGNVIMPNS